MHSTVLATVFALGSARLLTNGCWTGPGCTSTAIGIPFSTNWEMAKNNCWDSKQLCKAHNPQSVQSFCFANKGGFCVALQQSPGNYGDVSGMCYATKKQCNKNKNSPTPAPAPEVCFANKGGFCVALQQSPGNYGDVSGMCYATKKQCNKNKNSPTPSGVADARCQACLNKGNALVGSTWCWRTRKCYPTGAFWMPCSSKTCASLSPSSSCAVSNGGCVPPQ